MTRWGKCLAAALVVVLAFGVNAAAKDAVSFGETTFSKINANTWTVAIPLSISNTKNLAAIDIPLRFGSPGDGIDLREVDFESGRAHYFDLKAAVIDNEEKTVLIGLLWMANLPAKPELKIGDGHLATLIFEVTDPNVEAITLEPFRLENPGRELSFVYTEVGADGVLRVGELTPEYGPASFPVAAAGGSIPENWALHQNYPNPFNASTAISFALPRDSHVRLDVYNILGQRVATLADEFMDAGEHRVIWSDDSNASGVYFYRLQADDFTATRKMTLLK
jgi:hypothetical protein